MKQKDWSPMTRFFSLLWFHRIILLQKNEVNVKTRKHSSSMCNARPPTIHVSIASHQVSTPGVSSNEQVWTSLSSGYQMSLLWGPMQHGEWSHEDPPACIKNYWQTDRHNWKLHFMVWKEQNNTTWSNVKTHWMVIIYWIYWGGGGNL